MISIESSTIIQRPVETVFAFVSDARNDPQWHTDVLEATRTSEGPLGSGSTFCWIINFMGRKEMVVQITRYQPSHQVILQATSGPMLPTLTYTFTPADGGTRFTRHVDIQPAGLFRLMQPMMRSMIRKQNPNFLMNLKHALEN